MNFMPAYEVAAEPAFWARAGKSVLIEVLASA